jgi:hypothetical protein
MFLSYQTSAGMIGTEQAAGIAPAEGVRSQIQAALARADVATRLQTMGIEPKTVQDRVAALTDDEARDLAGKLDSVPAGAGAGWGIALIILVVFGYWWRYRVVR